MADVTTKNADLLLLHEVLEEEYVALHGPLPADYDFQEKDSQKRFAAISNLIHKLPNQRAAVCLSGGGIRSGTFSLGILQELASRGLLDKFHYLSTVSGGGYIGSWLTAWIHRHPKGLKAVSEELAFKNITPKFEPEPPQIRNLRQYSSFLTPRFSLSSADVWTFVAIYVRNLILNWLVLIPLILGILAIPRLCIAFVRVHPPASWGIVCSILLWIPLLLGVLCAGLAVGYMGISRPTVSDLLPADSKWRKPEYKDQASFLKRCLLPLSLSAILLTTYWAWNTALHFPPPDPTDPIHTVDPMITTPFFTPFSRSLVGFMALGVIIYLIGWIRYSLVLKPKWKELIFVLITGAVGGLLLWIVATKAFPSPVKSPIIPNPYALYPEDSFSANPTTALYVSLASPLFLVTVLLAITFFIGVTSRQIGKTLVFEDEDREWLSRLGGWVLIVALAWSLFSLIVVFGPVALWWAPTVITSLGGISGLIAVLGGHSANTPATDTQVAKGGLKALILDNVFTIAAFAFIVLFVAALSLVTSLAVEGILSGLLKGLSKWGGTKWMIEGLTSVSNWYGFDVVIQPSPPAAFSVLHLYKILHYTPVRYLVGWIGVLIGFGLLMAKAINLNKFSLHAGYRDRLIRAFLGGSRTEKDRQPNPFTGFDPTDNLQMHELRPGLLSLKSFIKETGDGKWKDHFGSFVLKLQAAKDFKGDVKTDLSAYLRSNLSEETRVMVDRYTEKTTASQSLKDDLIEDLNRILETHYLYLLPAVNESEVNKNMVDLIEFLDPVSAKRPVKEAQCIRSLVEERLLTAEEIERVRKLEQEKKELSTDNLELSALRGVYLIGLNRYILDAVYKEEITEHPFPLPAFKLMHVVNTALNLVKGEKLAWQQRKAEAFSFSPLHSGSLNPELGYRRSRDYGGPRGVSLGTALAISGAAANSNMGYLSTSSAVSFVMTLFNVRLGWWLGNPGPAGENYYKLGYPYYSIYPLVAEAFGLTDDKNSYVLLSDGGHFENLAIYEMVLRRCKLIVVVDGGQDGDAMFEDLGNAVRKIRIDFGIPIEFPEVSIFPRKESDEKKKKGRYYAIGKIHYGEVDKWTTIVDGHRREQRAADGHIIYIKPAFYGTDEPRDVYNYALAHTTFPHDPTADQWFDEPQFESYRALGRYVMDKIYQEQEVKNLLDQLT